MDLLLAAKNKIDVLTPAMTGDWYYINIRFKLEDGIDVKSFFRKIRNGRHAIAGMPSRWWFQRWCSYGLALIYKCGNYDQIHMFISNNRNKPECFIRHLLIRSKRLTKTVPEIKNERIPTGNSLYESLDCIINSQIVEDMKTDTPHDIKLLMFGGFWTHNTKTKRRKNEKL